MDEYNGAALHECAVIVKREGGFVNDPDDPGGATKWGVTLETAKRLGLATSKRELRKLTSAQAAQVFFDEYWLNRPFRRLDGLGQEKLVMSMFDQSVHSGHSAAVRVLQEMLQYLGLQIEVDGVCGAATVGAAKVAQSFSDSLHNAYGEHRRARYLLLARNRPSLRKYVVRRGGGKGGWIKRAEDYMDSPFHVKPSEWDRVREQLPCSG